MSALALLVEQQEEREQSIEKSFYLCAVLGPTNVSLIAVL
jgi:hypothetical protein